MSCGSSLHKYGTNSVCERCALILVCQGMSESSALIIIGRYQPSNKDQLSLFLVTYTATSCPTPMSVPHMVVPLSFVVPVLFIQLPSTDWLPVVWLPNHMLHYELSWSQGKRLERHNWWNNRASGKHLECYLIEGIDFFIWPISLLHLQTFRSICHAKLDPSHQQELASWISFIVTTLLGGADIISFILPIMLVFQDVMPLIPTWI
jgi:hypothetical protein